MSSESSPIDFKESKIKDNIVITDPETVPIIFHKQKNEILKHLIKKDLTIANLKQLTELNPGTIKRHIDDLESKGLIFLSQQHQNRFGFNMKFYRAVAKEFIINIKFP